MLDLGGASRTAFRVAIDEHPANESSLAFEGALSDDVHVSRITWEKEAR